MIGSILLIQLLLLVGKATCLAVSNPPNVILGVISTNRDGGISKTFSFDDQSVLVNASDHSDSSAQGRRNNNNYSTRKMTKQIKAAFRSTFLPAGYPSKTPVGYLSYSVWAWTQDMSTQLRVVLATQRVLVGVGVGREGASALSAIMNFIIRDGCGMAANLLFTWVAASRFKSDIKRWRLMADIFVNLGITLEVAATNLPPAFFLPMICIGGMCKAICGVAAGACGGAISVHWATGSDISDIMATQGAQNTVTGSLGLVFAALFARSVSAVNETRLWIMYTILTLLHMVANMQCMRLVAFDSLNTSRMNMVAAEFFRWWNKRLSVPGQENRSLGTVDRNTPTKTYVGENLGLSLSNPQQVARTEPLFFLWRKPQKLTPYPIHFGISFEEFVRRTQKSLLSVRELSSSLKATHYLISAGTCHKRGRCIVVSLSVEAKPIDRAKAYFHALLLDQTLKELSATEGITVAEKNAMTQLEQTWNLFKESLCSCGWNLSNTELKSEGYHIALQSQ